MNQDFSNLPLSLPPLLDEFRAALQDEIEVAKRNSSNSAIPLINGHKVTSQGSAHQYAFLIDSVLNTPDGAPGDLVVPGQAPVAVTIVSVEGLRIVISVETDLGKFIPTARLQTNLTILMRKLIERIEKNAKQENSAAKRMLGNAPVTGIPYRPNSKPMLNEHQLSALESALGRNLTVIWGPPGTGKTHTIGTITEHLNTLSRTVLLVSHTNTAVDQAIKHVAKFMKSQLADGAVVRVGEVKDDVLRSDFPDVLLKTQIERKSRELVKERELLASKRQHLTDEMADAQKSIEIAKWLSIANKEIGAINDAIAARDRFRNTEKQSTDKLNKLRKQQSNLIELHKLASNMLRLQKLIANKDEESSQLQEQFRMLSKERQVLTARIAEQNSKIEIAVRINPVRRERFSLPSQNEQTITITTLSDKLNEKKQKLTTRQHEYASAQALLEQTLNAGAIVRILKRLPKPEDQRTLVNSLSKEVDALGVEMIATTQAHTAATAKLAKIIEMDGELERYKDIKTFPQEQKEKDEAEQKLEQITRKKSELDSRWSGIQADILKLKNENKELSRNIRGDIKTIYSEVCAKLQELKQLEITIREDGNMATEMQSRADSLLSNSVITISNWVDFGDVPKSTEECLSIVRDWYSRLAVQFSSIDIVKINEKIVELRTKIQSIGSKIAEIDAKLTLVEREVINNAAVIGATLTKTYLSDEIQSRKFDTVILDEASMAPIPALWAAALLSEKNLIIVGDFKQLPPIVLSNNAITQKWLGRDIFEVSGIKDKWVKNVTPPHFVPLFEQRRMLPDIANVANLFYDNKLQNAFTTPEQYKDFNDFSAWYVKKWKYDNPIVLVDTGSLNAWVTSVVKHGNSSRLNFLSATVAVDIAEQLLSPDRPVRPEGSPKRVLIVSPYRAHAKLITVLLKDFNNLQDDVVAGTAHSFQGSEADVVIFDMVVDEPHFRVNLFMPSLDEELKGLLNVALTRAKFRLFVIGDFAYCQKQGRNAFLGKTLIPFLIKRFPRIDARNIVPEGLAARAAKTQMAAMGGQIDPNSERLVVTQDAFYRILSSDFKAANNKIIIYSPFATTERVSFLLPQLQAAVERGIEVYIITKALSERTRSELTTIKKIENQLVNIGIAIIHKLRMHEKLVFIDEEVTWSGSLNPLSFSNTQEIMERRKSKAVLKDYFQILRLNELLYTHGKDEGKCPICGNEMIAAEGADEPFYWRCVNDECYTRGVDQPYPFDGVLTCGNCNSPVEYGYWGDFPHWRCTTNNKHRQKVFKSHLRLPKMAALVPYNERKKLCRLLNIDNFDSYVWGSETVKSTTPEQTNLFD